MVTASAFLSPRLETSSRWILMNCILLPGTWLLFFASTAFGRVVVEQSLAGTHWNIICTWPATTGFQQHVPQARSAGHRLLCGQALLAKSSASPRVYYHEQLRLRSMYFNAELAGTARHLGCGAALGRCNYCLGFHCIAVEPDEQEKGDQEATDEGMPSQCLCQQCSSFGRAGDCQYAAATPACIAAVLEALQVR